MSFYGSHDQDSSMFGLPLLTMFAVGGTVLLVVILLIIWGLRYRVILP
jgi:hypothetical protein